MKNLRWQILLGVSLVVASASFYVLHYFIFHDAHHIFIYLLGDIAFVPIEVLLVTLIIHRLLMVREKNSMMEKMNMVIGTFFSEVGLKLLVVFSDADPGIDNICKSLMIGPDWDQKKFVYTHKFLRKYNYAIDVSKVDLKDLTGFLLGKRDFLVRLLENPVLLEHQPFTNLLQATFHMSEELISRDDLDTLPVSDIEHLTGDIKRVYVLIVHRWLDYMKYLKSAYPYLFSLAMRKNPFDQKASVVVR